MSLQLRAAIAGFDIDPKNRHWMRNLARDYPELFLAAALSHLESDDHTSADSFIAALVLRQETAFERLTDPGRYSCERAISVFKRLLAYDPTLDFRLARMLPGRGDTRPEKVLNGKHAARAIDILERTSEGQRLLSLLGHLPGYPDPQISAKAALFISRRMNNPAWVEKQMVNDDPRVRANALEGAWGTKSGASRRMLNDCLSDSNNRVAGNALIGLHLSGSPDAVRLAVEMSRSEDPARRATAAWAMGRIGTADFIPRLSDLLRDESSKVKSAAIRSLVEIGKAETARQAAAAANKRPRVPEPAPVPDTQNAPPPEPAPALIEIRLDGSSFSARQK
jgi:hypothetical protein